MKQFTGSIGLYEYKFPSDHKLLLTDGTDFVLQKFNVAWLFDTILFYQLSGEFGELPFQKWDLIKEPDDKWRLECTDGNNVLLSGRSLFKINFPVDELTLYLENGVVFLPAEHDPNH